MSSVADLPVAPIQKAEPSTPVTSRRDIYIGVGLITLVVVIVGGYFAYKYFSDDTDKSSGTGTGTTINHFNTSEALFTLNFMINEDPFLGARVVGNTFSNIQMYPSGTSIDISNPDVIARYVKNNALFLRYRKDKTPLLVDQGISGELLLRDYVVISLNTTPDKCLTWNPTTSAIEFTTFNTTVADPHQRWFVKTSSEYKMFGTDDMAYTFWCRGSMNQIQSTSIYEAQVLTFDTINNHLATITKQVTDEEEALAELFADIRVRFYPTFVPSTLQIHNGDYLARTFTSLISTPNMSRNDTFIYNPYEQKLKSGGSYFATLNPAQVSGPVKLYDDEVSQQSLLLSTWVEVSTADTSKVAYQLKGTNYYLSYSNGMFSLGSTSYFFIKRPYMYYL